MPLETMVSSAALGIAGAATSPAVTRPLPIRRRRVIKAIGTPSAEPPPGWLAHREIGDESRARRAPRRSGDGPLAGALRGASWYHRAAAARGLRGPARHDLGWPRAHPRQQLEQGITRGSQSARLVPGRDGAVERRPGP